ncbi:AN1-type zinc finger protein 1 [Mactra antiquata]
MAELPSLGKHCCFLDCKQLDFLPFDCDGCGKLFCKDHRTKDCHNCTKELSTTVSHDYTGVTGYTCTLDSCSNRELTEIVCNKCQQSFCLSHRHPQDHKCSKLEEMSSSSISKTAEHVNKIISSKPAVKNIKRGQGAKSSKTAAKVALMKMKMHAEGDNGCPVTERVYINVHSPLKCNRESKSMFFSKTWSVGRVIDSIANRLGIQNNNNVHLAKKLRLFHTEDGDILPTDCDLDSLVKQEILYSGSSLILEYVEENIQTLQDLSLYKIS